MIRPWSALGSTLAAATGIALIKAGDDIGGVAGPIVTGWIAWWLGRYNVADHAAGEPAAAPL